MTTRTRGRTIWYTRGRPTLPEGAHWTYYQVYPSKKTFSSSVWQVINCLSAISHFRIREKLGTDKQGGTVIYNGERKLLSAAPRLYDIQELNTTVTFVAVLRIRIRMDPSFFRRIRIRMFTSDWDPVIYKYLFIKNYRSVSTDTLTKQNFLC